MLGALRTPREGGEEDVVVAAPRRGVIVTWARELLGRPSGWTAGALSDASRQRSAGEAAIGEARRARRSTSVELILLSDSELTNTLRGSSGSSSPSGTVPAGLATSGVNVALVEAAQF